jgi:hypothetical protein
MVFLVYLNMYSPIMHCVMHWSACGSVEPPSAGLDPILRRLLGVGSPSFPPASLVRDEAMLAPRECPDPRLDTLARDVVVPCAARRLWLLAEPKRFDGSIWLTGVEAPCLFPCSGSVAAGSVDAAWYRSAGAPRS